MNDIVTVGDNAYLGEVQAALITTSSSSLELVSDATDPVDIGKYHIAPWGDTNDLPQLILAKIEKAEVIEANLLFNICVGYGQGLKPMRKVFTDGVITYQELDPNDADYAEVLDFFEQNDIEGYYLEQLTDLHTFFNTFPEIIVDKGKKKITSLKSKEATMSRWGSMQTYDERIMFHYYCAQWDDSPTKADIKQTKVLDRFAPMASLEKYLKTDKQPNLRYIYHVNFPTPGRSYYQKPYWWSIFASGWYDILVRIPKIKDALLKNRLGVRYIIYLHPDYWNAVYDKENIDIEDTAKKQAAQKKELQNLNDFIAGESSAGKGIISTKNYRPVANGVVEEKWIEIVPLPTVIKDGELVADSEEAANIISYAQGVHTNLLGSTPGKNSGSLGGSDKRELFNIKVAMMAPFISRIIKPLYLIKQFNKWPKDVVFINTKIEFTTLDENKSGSQTSNNE